MSCNFYLINLDRSADRLASAQSQLETAGIGVQRISGVDGKILTPEQYAQCDQDKARRYMGRPVVDGEIGCYLSHLRALETFLRSDAKYAIIFEDDMRLAEDFNPVIETLIDRLDQTATPWDVVNISSPERKFYRKMADIGSRELRHALYFPMRANGVLWSRAGAADFIANFSTIYAPYDNALREWQSVRARGLSLFPPAVTPVGIKSTIDEIQGPRNTIRGSRLFARMSKQKRLFRIKFRALKNLVLNKDYQV